MFIDNKRAVNPDNLIKFVDDLDKFGFSVRKKSSKEPLYFRTKNGNKYKHNYDEHDVSLNQARINQEPTLTLSEFMKTDNGNVEGSFVKSISSMESTLGRESKVLNCIASQRMFGGSGTGKPFICGSFPESVIEQGSTLEQVDASTIMDNTEPAYFANNIALELPQFRFGFLTKPKIQASNIGEEKKTEQPHEQQQPAPLPELESYLLSPETRRKQLEKVVNQHRAASTLHKARAQEARKHNLMKTAYKNGILGVDSPMTKSTVFYANDAEKQLKIQCQRKLAANTRSSRIQSLSSSEGRLGYKILSHISDNEVKEQMITRQQRQQQPQYSSSSSNSNAAEKIFQSKLRVPIKYPSSFSNFYDRKKFIYDPKRAEKLRSEEMRGKRYNIVSGAKLPSMADPNNLPGWMEATEYK